MSQLGAIKKIISPNASINRIVLGSIVHSIKFGEIQIIDNGGIIYNNKGVITDVVDFSKRPLTQDFLQNFDKIGDFRGKLIIPGFIDAHCHSPQYPFTGTGMDLPLLEWLEKYTFPCEAKFANEEFARKAYEKSIQRHLKCGTTFASYFATIHNNSCKVLVDVIQQVGQRAHVGKVSMDRNSPPFYTEETKEGMKAAQDFIEYVLSLTEIGKQFLYSVTPSFVSESVSKKFKTDARVGPLNTVAPTPARLRAVTLDYDDNNNNAQNTILSPMPSSSVISSSSVSLDAALRKRTVSEMSTTSPESSHFVPTITPMTGVKTLLNSIDTPLVMPCITPRFVPTCTPDIMQKLGELATTYGLPIQSHMSESLNEIEWVLNLHPECSTYASVYEQYNLLSSKAYMAHCCHSSKEERAIMKRTGASVVHCASSNFMLNSGVMDVRLFLEEGINVAIGTDVAGGYSPSMLDALRQTMIASRVKGFDHRTLRALMAESCINAKKLQQENNSNNNGSSSMSSETSSIANEGLTTTSTSSLDDGSSSSEDNNADAEESTTITKNYQSLNYAEAFHLATMGGAEVLGMGDVLGNFMVGKKLDCLIIDVNATNSPIDVFENESTLEYFQKFLFLGDDRNIIHVYVDGKQVI